MVRSATKAARGATVLLAAAFLGAPAAPAQSARTPDWYHLGNSLIDLSLAGLATGPVNRVWYAPDGSALFASTDSGKTFETKDFTTWQAASELPPAPLQPASIKRVPEPAAQLRASASDATLYAFGRFIYRSGDGGANWQNLTSFESQSILGDPRDLAVSPSNPQDVTAASSAGVFRSLDGGISWSGLNQGLPNLPAAHILALPNGDRGAALEFSDSPQIVEWQPGERQAWRPASSQDAASAAADLQLRAIYTQQWGVPVTALRRSGDVIYAGTADGSIRVSRDRGISWQSWPVDQGGPVESFWIDPQDARIALAALSSRPHDPTLGAAAHILRTGNAGEFWDDLTGNLPDLPTTGVTASETGNAIYAATPEGVFYARTDPAGSGAGASWQPLAGLPAAAVSDVQLDAGENQLWAEVEGYGLYSTLAPHRLGDPRVVSAADMAARAAAPGALMSVVGARVTAANAGDLSVPVLAADDNGSQIQIPFEATGGTLSLAIRDSAQAPAQTLLPPMTLQSAAPAILEDPDGSPWALDAATGTMLDTVHPAHSRTRIQILATGLGRVIPDWPTGLAAPLTNQPRVAAAVQATLDGAPAEVTRATLAPGYVGMYLVEIELPKIVDYGPAELMLNVDGHPSNRVRVYIEP